jgi:hypothetical protein
MKRSTKSFAKNASNLYQSIHQQLSVYAGAAVMAVVSILALTQPSEAKIVYTPANVVLSCQHPHIYCHKQYMLGFNHGGVVTITVVFEDILPVCSWYEDVGEETAYGAGVMGTPPAALNEGAQIGHGQSFYGGEGVMAWGQDISCRETYGGHWYNPHVPVTAYLGLRFQLNGRNHYGWARLTVEGASHAKLTGYAFETIAGKSIKAGQTQGALDDSGEEDFGHGASLTNPIPDKPQPISLGMIALGAQGVPMRRRNESALEGDLKGAL